jgi:anti-sigma regulatory factor (Ser/Thr protein kinase)
MIAPQALRRGIRMTFPRFDVPISVHADRTRLKQVIINLLSNAIKYNAIGGTVVVECCGEHSPGRVRITVTDTGSGLSSEQIGQLFQPFNRLGQQANSEEGTGIGLVVSKRLMELMDGLVGVESTVGAGSVFWIEMNSTAQLPVAKNGHDVEATPPLLTGEAQRTVLYVEDNPANLKLVERLIARRPEMRLLTAIDGRTGSDPHGYQSSGDQRHRSTEDPASRSGHRPHPGGCSERQRGPARRPEGPGSRFLPLSDQADQSH